MNAQLLELVDKARAGEADAFARLVEALRACVEATPVVLSEASGSVEPVLRRAAARVAASRADAGAAQAAAQLARDAAVEVRKTLAEALAASVVGAHDEVVGQLLQDDDDEV